MYVNGKHINNLEEADIKRLFSSGIREGKTLEYKRELNISEEKDKNRQEFLFDIAAMYNTEGGCIIYGIEELKDEKNKNTGLPGKLVHQTLGNFDQTVLTIHDIVRNYTDPSIGSLIVRSMIVDGAMIVIVGIGKVWGLPSMVTFNTAYRFYRRNTTGKYLPDTFELNQVFMQHGE